MMSMANTKKAPTANKRRNIRFAPEDSTIALIEVAPFPTSKAFKPSVTGLVFSESHGGCGVVVVGAEDLKAGSMCKIQVGKLAPMKAEIRWRKDLDDSLAKLGLMYLE